MEDPEKTKERGQRPKWLQILQIMAALVLASLAGVVGRGLGSELLGGRASAEQAFEREVASIPALTALRETFPDDYQEVRRSVIELTRSSRDTAAIKGDAFTVVRHISVRHVNELLAAPDADLRSYADFQRRIAVALQESDVGACAEFGMTGFQKPRELSPGVLALMGDAMTLQFRAARKGLDHPIRRSAPTDADWSALVSQINLNTGSLATSRLIFENGLPHATKPQQCAATVALYTAMSQLPPARSAALQAHFLREAVKAGGFGS